MQNRNFNFLVKSNVFVCLFQGVPGNPGEAGLKGDKVI